MMPGNGNILISWWKGAVFRLSSFPGVRKCPTKLYIVPLDLSSSNMGQAVRISKISQSIAEI